jgi:arginyl-tRNA synthetase
MSSRLGTVQLLSDILNASSAAMHAVMRQNAAKYAQVADPGAVADAVGLAAVMVQDMRAKRFNNYPFDLARMTSFEGDTGPYLQYCRVRLCSVRRRTGVSRGGGPAAQMGAVLAALGDDIDGQDSDEQQHCVDLLRLMAQYPDVAAMAYKTIEPSTVLTYLFRLAHQLSSSYEVLQLVVSSRREGGRDEVMPGRAALYEAARQILENGMRLLGLTPVER